MMNYSFELFADYFQLYLMDVETNDDTSDIWTDKALDLKLALLPNTVAIGTFRNVYVPLQVEVCESKPTVNLDEWDHASEGYFTITSGLCAVFGCTDYLPDATKVQLKPAEYSVLSLAKGLDSITEEWEDADDVYKVVIWPSTARDHRSLKEYGNHNKAIKHRPLRGLDSQKSLAVYGSVIPKGGFCESSNFHPRHREKLQRSAIGDYKRR